MIQQDALKTGIRDLDSAIFSLILAGCGSSKDLTEITDTLFDLKIQLEELADEDHVFH